VFDLYLLTEQEVRNSQWWDAI